MYRDQSTLEMKDQQASASREPYASSSSAWDQHMTRIEKKKAKML